MAAVYATDGTDRRRLTRLPLLAAALSLMLVLPGVAAADVEVSLDDGAVVVQDTDAAANFLEIRAPADRSSYTVEDTLATQPVNAGAGCAQVDQHTVTCDRPDPDEPGGANVTLGNGEGVWVEFEGPVGDVMLQGGDGDDQVNGGPGDDVLHGNGGDDALNGGAGADQLHGDDGDDDLNGEADADLFVGGLGSDLFADTGNSGGDVVVYGEGERTLGVDVTMGGPQDVWNDGSEEDESASDPDRRDRISSGEIENVTGSLLDDAIDGDGLANVLRGSDGDDVLTGGDGTDDLNGGSGQDTLEARDGKADSRIDCDEYLDAPEDVPNTAYIDRGLDDAAVVDCSTVLPPASTGGGGTDGGTDGGGPTGGGSTDGGGSPPPPPLNGGAPPATFFDVVLTGSTVAISQMPAVVGVKAQVARERVLDAIPNADVDVDFRRGCAESRDYEVMRQSPVRGAAVTNHQQDPVAVSLLVCLADRDFLRDCDLTDLRKDLRKLRGRQDAEFAATILNTVNRCKVDFDIKMAKQREEAEMRLKAQREAEARRKRFKKKAEIRAAIDCPAKPEETDLRVYAGESYVLGRLDTSLGLRASGPDGWTLPADFRAFVTLEGIDRAFQFLGNPTTYIDADDVTSKGNTMRRQVREWQDGRLVFNLTPEKPGVIRICTILETGGDEVLTHALQIRVVPHPPKGTIWETVGGRLIEIDGNDATWLTEEQVRRKGLARAAILDQVWNWVVGLFDGRSRTVNAESGERRASQQKVEATYTRAKLGVAQLTLDGSLEGDPQPPVLGTGPCAISQPDGTLSLGTCEQLRTAADNAALLGVRFGANPLVAAGAGNVIESKAADLVAAGAGNLIGMDGSSLVGPDGSSLVGPDGSSLVGPDGSSLVGNNGNALISDKGVGMVAAGGGNAIATAPAQLVAAGAGNLIGMDGSSLLPQGALP